MQKPDLLIELSAEKRRIRRVLERSGASVRKCDDCGTEYIIHLDGGYARTCTDCMEAALDNRQQLNEYGFEGDRE